MEEPAGRDTARRTAKSERTRLSTGAKSEPLTDVSDADGCPSGIGADAGGSHCQHSGEVSRTISDRSFGLQGAHAESADEFDALLDDAQNAGFSGVDRLNGASLIAKVIKTRECRADVVLESHSRRVKQQLRVLPGEVWSFSRCNDQMVRGHCGKFKTL